VSLIES